MATAAEVPPPKQRSRFKRVLITSLKVSLYTFIVAAVALIIAVSVAVSQLPSFQEMVRRDDLGQMIRVARRTVRSSRRWGRASASGFPMSGSPR